MSANWIDPLGQLGVLKPDSELFHNTSQAMVSGDRANFVGQRRDAFAVAGAVARSQHRLCSVTRDARNGTSSA